MISQVFVLRSALFPRGRIAGPAWFALIPGVLGVLLVLRPDIRSVTRHGLLPFLAAMCYALAMIITWATYRTPHGPARPAAGTNQPRLTAATAPR